MDEFKIDLEQAEDLVPPPIPETFTHKGGIGTFKTYPVYELDGFEIGDKIVMHSCGTQPHTVDGVEVWITCFIDYHGNKAAGLNNGGIAEFSYWKPWKST